MKKLLLATALCALAAPAYAQVVDDPLHLCYATGCSSFGGVTISTLGGSGAAGWGVSSSPAAQSGDLYLALLIPNNENEVVLPTLSGTLNGNPLSPGGFINEGTFSAGQDLTNVLGAAIGGTVGAAFAASNPPNPFNAYIGATDLEDPGATSYTILLVNVDPTFKTGTQAGQTSTLDNSFALNGGDYLMGLMNTPGIAPGAIVTAFLLESTTTTKKGVTTTKLDVVSTAQSSSLLIQPTAASPVPEPGTWAMLFSGFVLMGLFGWRKARTARYAL